MDSGENFFKAMAFLLGFLFVVNLGFMFVNFFINHNFTFSMPNQTATSTKNTSSDPNFARIPDGCTIKTSRLNNSANTVFSNVRGGIICHFMINDKLPTYTFEFKANVAQNTLERMTIKEYDTDTLIQEARITMDSEPPAGLDVVSVEDFNFDGYQDLKIIDWWGATGNIGYTIWLFNPTTNTFIEHAGLSKLTNPTIIPNTKTISSHSVGGMAGCVYTDQTYSIDTDNNLLLQHEEKQEWNNSTQSLTRSIKTLIDGTFKTSAGTGICGI